MNDRRKQELLEYHLECAAQYAGELNLTYPYGLFQLRVDLHLLGMVKYLRGEIQ